MELARSGIASLFMRAETIYHDTRSSRSIFHMRAIPSVSLSYIPSAFDAWRWLAIYVVVSGALYFWVTHAPMAPVVVLRPWPYDAVIPRVSASVPLYLSYALVMPSIVWFGRGRNWLLPAFFAGALAAGLCIVSHLFWPTAVSRSPAVSGWIAWLYRIDTPLAASPCGHVALPVAVTVVLAALRVRAARYYAAWSAILALTVLTTGQHLLADMLAGLALGVGVGGATTALIRLDVDLRTAAALLLEWLCIVVALRVALSVGHWGGYLVAAVIVATRQHALFILYHDATHYHLTRRRFANDFLINLAIGVPGLVPIEFYRPLHLAHHRHVGTADDPERNYLYHAQPWKFEPLDTLPLIRQLLGDLFVVNMVKNMRAYRRANGRGAPMSLPLLAAISTWGILLVPLVHACTVRELLTLAALWFVPLVTIGALVQKIRSIAEHSGGPGVTAGWNDWTYSWRVGLLGRFFIWPYNINYHQQHHREPGVAWHRLPGLRASDEPVLSSRQLPALLWSGASRRGSRR
ncbi:fatty acid desaturase family protein [Burkholderia cepacia]|uniref:fatty acid desaturase family protein n=2 Tax=Burkholderia cepacia TaxID=292 RepID=UPI001CB0950E|nr:fatty acid desaturase family protein [Burkholderia cepacia]CAG9264530.1 Fatty acid desaturase [Burkholderia cepacia]